MATTRIIQTVRIFTNKAIIGVNPENADMSNPEGYIWGNVSILQAEGATGRRYNHKADLPLPELEKLEKRVRAARVINLEHWVETYPAYGSVAYEVENADRDFLKRAAIFMGDEKEADRLS